VPGSYPIDPATLPDPIRDELLAPDPVAIDTAAAELKDGANRCPKCGATDIRQRPGTDLLICLYCRNEWHGQRVEEEFGFGEGLDELTGTVIASGARDIDTDVSSLMTYKCTGCGAEVTVNTESTMTARCHWCRHVFGVNEQVANGAVPDAVLPFHIKKDDAVARIRQFVDKRRLFALKEFKEQFTPGERGRRVPALHDRGRQGERRRGRARRDRDPRYTRGSGDNKKTYYDADVYEVERHVDFTVDDLPLESSSRARQPDTRRQHQQHHQHDPAVRHQERGEVERQSYLTGFTSEKRDPTWSSCARGPGGPAAVDRPLPGRGQSVPLRSRRALGAGTPGRARHPLGGDVPARVAVLLPAAGRQRRDAALHRGQRPHRRDHGQRAGTAMEAAAGRAHRRHLPRRHCHSGCWGPST
jgi:DNA-directed RNA polymerase subunit RPC12/RpoP